MAARLPEDIYSDTTNRGAVWSDGVGSTVVGYNDQSGNANHAVAGASLDAPGFRAFQVDKHRNGNYSTPSAFDRRFNPEMSQKHISITGAPIFDLTAPIVLGPLADSFIDVWAVGQLLTGPPGFGAFYGSGRGASNPATAGIWTGASAVMSVIATTSHIGVHEYGGSFIRTSGSGGPTQALQLFGGSYESEASRSGGWAVWRISNTPTWEVYCNGVAVTTTGAPDAAFPRFSLTGLHGFNDLSMPLKMNHMATAVVNGGSREEAAEMDEYFATILPTTLPAQTV
jgi:hypothetical protein